MFGTVAMGIRTPIVSQGDDLVSIVVSSVTEACQKENLILTDNSVIGITEGVVAKAQGNYASLDDIARSTKELLPSDEVAVVFPILSRNRFGHILKAISLAYKKVHLLLLYPDDELGNPIMDKMAYYQLEDTQTQDIYTAEEFAKISGDYRHPFTGVNYLEFYTGLNNNISVYLSEDPRTILRYCKNVIVSSIHSRFILKTRLEKAGAEQVICLSDILTKPVEGGKGFNPEFGIMGSNLSTNDSLKLFPRDSNKFVREVQAKIESLTGVAPQVLVYGDGAFKDPVCGIWELCDPVVSPGFTDGLAGMPHEIKIKYIADNELQGLSAQEKREAILEKIAEKQKNANAVTDGTTPRRYTDLIGSLCDLITGSGDKGTPVVLIQGYFDDFSAE